MELEIVEDENFEKAKETISYFKLYKPIFTKRGKDVAMSLILPKFATRIRDKKDPWLPKTPRFFSKILGISPLGNIRGVPTSNKSIVRRKRALPEVELEIIEVDPLLTASIYFDLREHNKKVTEKAKRIRKHIREVNGFESSNVDLIPLKGQVNRKEFKAALEIYERNQVYYSDCLDNQHLSLDEISEGLVILETWFCLIISPKPINKKWKEREFVKITKGYSYRCDENLKPHFPSLSLEIRKEIREMLKKVMT